MVRATASPAAATMSTTLPGPAFRGLRVQVLGGLASIARWRGLCPVGEQVGRAVLACSLAGPLGDLGFVQGQSDARATSSPTDHHSEGAGLGRNDVLSGDCSSGDIQTAGRTMPNHHSTAYSAIIVSGSLIG